MPSTPSAAGAIAFRLPNARQGEPYSQALIHQPPGGAPPIFDAIVLPEDLGMTADLASGVVSGTPRAAGEHQVTLAYHLAQAPQQRRQAVFSFLVNPDPKSMWQNLPSDRADVYWQADQECAALAGADFHMLAASKRGRSHAHKGGFRDDAYAIDALAQSGWHLAVLADGAGSARYSRRGARLICDSAARHLAQALNGNAAGTIERAALAFALARDADGQAPAQHAALHQQLAGVIGAAAYQSLKAIYDEIAAQPQLNASVKDFASTAIISACKRYPFGILCVAYWVGDGAAALYRDGAVTLLGAVDSGEYSGQTRFLDQEEVTQEALMRRTRFELVDDMQALILMTDGVSDARFETDSRLARVDGWDALWREIDAAVGLQGPAEGRAQRLLDWLDFWSPGNHDDRTIALIYQEQQA